MKKKQLIVGLVVLAAVAALLAYAQHRHPFHWHVFVEQLKLADWTKIVLALGCIYAGYIFRSVRWALLMRHSKKVPPLSLVGTQVIGFTAVALIGRVADLVRPYLVAKRTAQPLSSQIAVYIVERLCDMGSMALIFSISMLWIPQTDVLKATTGHSAHMSALALHSPLLAAFLARFGGLVLTLLGVLFLVMVRVSGPAVAVFCERGFGLVSAKLGVAAGHKIRTFHSGLDTIHSLGDFCTTASLSLVMWGLIATAYFESCQAFVASPPLAAITIPKCVLLMIASGGASIIQLPVLGWFTQIGIVAATLAGLFGASPEASTACAATLLAVTFLGIIPVGLIWARFDHVSLRKVAADSELAEEALAEKEPAG